MTAKPNEFERLMERVRCGCDQAVEQVSRTYGPHILRVVRRKLDPQLRRQFDSGDFAQAVWASFFAVSPDRYTFHSPKELINFLCAVASNKVVEEFRRRLTTQKHKAECELEALALHSGPPDARQPTPSKLVAVDQDWEELLRRQPPLIREMLVLRQLGFTHDEIAERMRLNPKTIQRHLRKVWESCNRD